MEEILRLEKARSGVYAGSPAGSVHLRYLRRFLRVTKKARRAAQKQQQHDSSGAEAGIVTRQARQARHIPSDGRLHCSRPRTSLPFHAT